MALNVTVSRGNVNGLPPAAPTGPGGTLVIDGYGNYFEVVNGKAINIGWDRVNALGGSTAAHQIDDVTAHQYRLANGLDQPNASEKGAQAAIKSALDGWGLGSLADWAWQQMIQGSSQDAVLASLREQDAYKVRFAGNVNRQKAGLPPLSEAQYLAYESQARQMMRAAGLPATLFDAPDDFATYIGGDVSVSELASRVELAQHYANTDPTVSAEQRAEMKRLYGEGGLAAYYLDPQKALPTLQRQAAAVEAAAAAQRTGFGQLTRQQAERTSELSGSIQQTAQAFTQLAKQKELMKALPGELGVDAITADQQIAGALGGDANVQNELSRRARKRAADMQAQKGDYKYGAGRSSTGSF